MLQFLQLIAFIIVVLVVVDGFLVKTYAYCDTTLQGLFICDIGDKIDYPFYSLNVGSDTNEYCGYQELGIRCANFRRQIMNISNHPYYVQTIDYTRKTLTVVDVDTDGQECPQPKRNFSLQSTPSLHYSNPYTSHSSYLYNYNLYNYNLTIFYNCSSHPKDVIQYLPCLNNKSNNSSLLSFGFFDDDIPKGFNWYGNCMETVVVPVTDNSDVFPDYSNLKLGISLYWSTPSRDCKDCERSGGECSFSTTKGGPACSCKDGTWVFRGICPKGISTGVKVILGIVTGLGGLLLILLIIYRRSIYSYYLFITSHTNVDVFLESCGRLPVQRYRYIDIKKMTNSFKTTLGQGGYGSVFKGNLGDDHLVAVKVLNESKGNGEDFINEVAAISRTNHVNVVSLLGFCSDGTKRALVYEFMSNGSLEKFIYNTTSPSLGWEKLYQIALGIARGLEYLHRGCNTRILHFDIKPHNILLDQDFCPKISDFGLAKLCPTRESVVSMVGARGTIGYIAPEVYCRNFGGVSHKSDVYSYGMMVLEMIGGRKNIDAKVEIMSEIYFPHWIYNHLKGDIKIEGAEDIKIEGSGETFEDEMAKKMIIVALWCIQTHPVNRPSVSNVVEMLEGNIEEMQMPPNPFEDPPPSRFSSSST